MDECTCTATQQKAGMGGPSPALDLNGRQYGALQAEPVADQAGFYQAKPNGILLLGIDREPFAFVVTDERQGQFFVSCFKHGSDIRYMFSTTSADEQRLGIAGISVASEAELVRSLVNQLTSGTTRTDTREATITMACSDEDFAEREFAQVAVSESGKPDFACKHCGWLQSSTAAGAAELIAHGTWHSEEGRAEFAAKAAKYA
ncbi:MULTISPECIES: hypothetical protein [Cupriavidus]|uniref:hypothetical protein n=1 Tax=Cupriavidus TaxID=106589 RepID=UPI0011EE1932|nr:MULTISPECIES: hypothetical protein [Cupriavidus]MWL91876.1 hypothetical protein [Cupriavidus sp. SW-Y-13]